MNYKRPSRLTGSLIAIALGMIFGQGSVAMAQSQSGSRHFDIGDQLLASALNEFARQSDWPILFSTAVVYAKRTQGIKGEWEPEAALRQLLQGTGLTYRVTADDTILIESPRAKETATGPGSETLMRFAQASETAPSQAENTEHPEKQTSDQEPPGKEDLEEVVVTVTGSRIRGAKSASPVITITQEDMRRSGQNNVGDVMRALPQNFGGGQNPGVSTNAAAGGVANLNFTGSSGPNLRGLGPAATLTLLNGTRLPYDGLHQATDVSVIPVAAVERVEVLLDGASAIYGSDAIGGVVNIVLKRDYDGAELSARFGESTDGGFEQTQYTGVAGRNWVSGGFLVTADFSRNSEVRANQRDYVSYLSEQRTSLFPENSQQGALFTSHQQIGDVAEATLDAFFTQRRNEYLYSNNLTSIGTSQSDSTIWGLAPAVAVELPADWMLRVRGFVGSNEAEVDGRTFDAASGVQTFRTLVRLTNESQAIGVEADGPVFSLPGGAAQLSIGGGYRENVFDNFDAIAGTRVNGGESRSNYFFGEVNLPLIGEDQEIPFVSRFSLSGAVRYEDYNRFGETTTPKIGAIWGIAPGFDVRASWGKSFKVPTLLQQNETHFAQLRPASQFPGASAGTTILVDRGGNPDLIPERAEITTAGFVAEPEFLPGVRVEFGWFDIDYTDRVVNPHPSFLQALVNPAGAEFVILNPSVAQQNAVLNAVSLFQNLSGAAYNPATVYAIVNNRYMNASTDQLQGIDLFLRYRTDFLGGDLAVNATGNWILDDGRRLTSLAPEQRVAGVAFFPPEFRGRLSATWALDDLALTGTLNQVGATKDNLVLPVLAGDDMTTLDVVADYQFDSPVFGEVGLNFAVLNLFDDAPPLMRPAAGPTRVNYDSTNYSPLGRVINVTIMKRF